jgi:hypothetical protein
MGNSRYSAEDRKANQDAHEARMAQFTKAEAGAKARRVADEHQEPDAVTATPEPVVEEQEAVASPDSKAK